MNVTKVLSSYKITFGFLLTSYFSSIFSTSNFFNLFFQFLNGNLMAQWQHVGLVCKGSPGRIQMRTIFFLTIKQFEKWVFSWCQHLYKSDLITEIIFKNRIEFPYLKILIGHVVCLHAAHNHLVVVTNEGERAHLKNHMLWLS